jgi:hypothetical protein
MGLNGANGDKDHVITLEILFDLRISHVRGGCVCAFGERLAPKSQDRNKKTSIKHWVVALKTPVSIKK